MIEPPFGASAGPAESRKNLSVIDFNLLYVQKAILSKLSEITKQPFRLASPDEEAKGIDGYIGATAYSIKPDTYKAKKMLNETIKVRMIYYKKTKSGLSFEIEE